MITVVVSLGSNLTGGGILLRSDTVFNHAPWRAAAPTDLEITPISGTDPVDSGFPAHVQFFGRANDGDFAEWNPYPSGGVPLGAVPNTGPFDPLNLPFLFLADEHAPVVGKLLELALALGGMLLFLRRLGVTNSVALVGGLIYAFNGFQTFWTNWPQSHAAALIPWLFWAGEGLLKRRSKRSSSVTSTATRRGLTGPSVVLVLTTTLMLLTGFPAITVYALGTLVVYIGARTYAERHHGEQWMRLTRRAATKIAAVVALACLGIGLAAWQLAPFSAQLETVDTEYRTQTSQDRLPSAALLTTAVPNVIGSYAQDRIAPLHNYFEVQSFLGAGALILVGAAFIRRRPRGVPPWIVPTLALMVACVVMLVYFGGPLLVLAQKLPVLDTNAIGRMRSVLLFMLSVLAALGLASVTQPLGASGPAIWITRLRYKLHRYFKTVVGLATGALVAVTVAVFWHATAPERSHGHGGAVGRTVLLAMAAAAIVGGVVALSRRHELLRRSAPVIVAVVAAVEILVLVVPWWPNTDPELHYPLTPTHEFLLEQGEGDRIATHDLTMYSGTTGYYGIRTVSGHSFHWPTWRDMLLEVDPLAQDWNDTFTILDFRDRGRMGSPVLDRLAVRWIVLPLYIASAGTPHRLFTRQDGVEQSNWFFDEPAHSAQILNGESISRTVRAEPIRGLAVYLPEPLTTTDPNAQLVLDVTTDDGEVFTVWRPIKKSLPAGWLWIALAGENIAATNTPGSSSTMTISLTLQATDGTARIGTSAGTTHIGTSAPGGQADGELTLVLMRPDDDNLRLTQVNGAAVWENLDAVPRIRFAPLATWLPEATNRLATLSQPLGAGIVVLSDEPPHPNPLRASVGEILSVDDTFDEMTITVKTDGPGYVVVADALQHGWDATIDGKPAPVLNADHAVVAVAVPAGISTIELTYNPPRLNLGITISAISAFALAALILLSRLYYRRQLRPTYRRLKTARH